MNDPESRFTFVGFTGNSLDDYWKMPYSVVKAYLDLQKEMIENLKPKENK